MNKKGTLIFFYGKMGAGKTTKSKTIAQEKNDVLISEGGWLSANYPFFQPPSAQERLQIGQINNHTPLAIA